jgi:uncharacterized protein YqhQ
MSAPIGGQAVLEGVMMRGPSAWSVAVRKPDGVIAEVNRPVTSILLRHRWLRVPIIRGIIALGESLSIGFRALAISANYAAQEEGEDGEVETELTRGQLIFAFGIAIGFALLLFKVSPALITNWLPIDSTGAFVVVEGLVRVTIFIVYLLIISMLPDLKRVFQYHAAEHKAINAYEAGEELTPENVQRYSLLHVRCGTIIRFAGRHAQNPILRGVLAPGLWLQRLTTREPSLDQVEVSIRALREVLRLEGRITPEERKVEVMA